MRKIQTIDINRYEGQKSVGTKTGYEVFDLLKSHLESVGLLPDEYFSPSHYPEMEKALPEYNEAVCHTNWGGSEGIYIDISLKYYDNRTPKEMHFATGKTLGASGDDFIRMSRIAAECSMMLNGFGSIVRVSEQEKEEPTFEKIECKFVQLIPGLIGQELDIYFEKNGWKLERWESKDNTGYQVFFGKNVQVDNNFEYGFPYLYEKEQVIAFAIDWFDEHLCGQNYFDFDFTEQTIDVSKFQHKRVPEERQINPDISYDERIYEIYQLKDDPEVQEMLFMNHDWLTRHKQSIDISKYNLVYSGSMEPNETLDDIYTRFNIDHPEDFKGHSLSVSDVVAIHNYSIGITNTYFVDTFGFKIVPDFFKEQQRAQGLDEQIRMAAEKSDASIQSNISEPER